MAILTQNSLYSIENRYPRKEGKRPLPLLCLYHHLPSHPSPQVSSFEAFSPSKRRHGVGSENSGRNRELLRLTPSSSHPNPSVHKLGPSSSRSRPRASLFQQWCLGRCLVWLCFHLLLHRGFCSSFLFPPFVFAVFVLAC